MFVICAIPHIKMREILLASSSKSSTVQSLQRALSLMDTLSQTSGGLSLKELAAKVSLPPSTAHRLLSTLSESGYVKMSTTGQRWSIGVQAFSVGQSFLNNRDLVEVAREPMIRLMEETQETVKMGLMSGDRIVVLTQIECSQPMRAFAETGASLPLHCTSLGKALLATRSHQEAFELVDDRLTAQTAKTLVTFESLWSDLMVVRSRGYAVQDEEYLVGLRGAAACIFGENMEAVAALSVNGPTVRIPSERLSQLGMLVAEVCADITNLYGGKRPALVAA